MAYHASGSDTQYKPIENRKDTRTLGMRISQELFTIDGSLYLLIAVVTVMAFSVFIPLGGELVLLVTSLMVAKYTYPKLRLHDFPWRVPVHAQLPDGSKNRPKNFNIKKNPEKLYGEGLTYLGVCRKSGLPVYGTNSDDRTHMVVLGTTGSGKTEFLLGLIVNQLVQNSGFIMCDAKGDPALQKEIYRLSRRFGREDDLLTLNFITSGRDLIKAQRDKITNTFNMMSNTSSGMLIELIVNLLDDSGGGGGDMWKGRCMAFIAALTRPLTYMRDGGFILLSPATYIEYMELPALEELVFNHGGKYGKMFDVVLMPLRAYVVTLPGYNSDPEKRKKQDQKTLEQHGFISMQLTRAINDLTYNYGHIFGVEQGDIDIFDVVLNRRILTVPLPALERTPDSLKMLGKLVVGSVKQMMAGSLGNRIEGVVREILDSRPTNSSNAFKLFLDEWGYIVVKGASVMPAQARSLNFSIVFAAQDFTDIKRGNAEEAEATWANSTVKVIGRITTGQEGETYKKASGFASQEWQARVTTTERKVGDLSDKFINSNNVQFQKEDRLPFEDLSGQENGEFTLLISKKSQGGDVAGVAVVRINGFYVAGTPPKTIRLNDLAPILTMEKSEIILPEPRIAAFIASVADFSCTRDALAKSNSIALGANDHKVGDLEDKTAIFMTENPIINIASNSRNTPLYDQFPIEMILFTLSQDNSIDGSGEINSHNAAHVDKKAIIVDYGNKAHKASLNTASKAQASTSTNLDNLSDNVRTGDETLISTGGAVELDVPVATFRFKDIDKPETVKSVEDILLNAGYKPKDSLVTLSLLTVLATGNSSEEQPGSEVDELTVAATSQQVSNIENYHGEMSGISKSEDVLAELKSAFEKLSSDGALGQPNLQEANLLCRRLLSELPDKLRGVNITST